MLVPILFEIIESELGRAKESENGLVVVVVMGETLNASMVANNQTSGIW